MDIFDLKYRVSDQNTLIRTMKATPVITMALFNNWKKFLVIGGPVVVGTSLYRKFTGDSERFFGALCDTTWQYFSFLSVAVGGAIMIDHLSILETAEVAIECPFELPTK
jgi:hypothetical protein